MALTIVCFLCYHFPSKALYIPKPQHLLLILRQFRQLRIHDRKLLLQFDHLAG